MNVVSHFIGAHHSIVCMCYVGKLYRLHSSAGSRVRWRGEQAEERKSETSRTVDAGALRKRSLRRCGTVQVWPLNDAFHVARGTILQQCSRLSRLSVENLQIDWFRI